MQRRTILLALLLAILVLAGCGPRSTAGSQSISEATSTTATDTASASLTAIAFPTAAQASTAPAGDAQKTAAAGAVSLPTVEVDTGGLALDLQANWTKGDKRTVERRKGGKSADDTTSTAQTMATTDIDITVLDASDTAYVLEWVYGQTKMDSGHQELTPSEQAMMDLATGLRVEYETDRSGSYTRVRNLPELKQQYNNMLGKMTEEMRKSGMGQAQADQMLAQMQSMIGSDEQIEAIFNQEIMLYHSLYGGVYELEQPFEYEDELPNMLGGTPFPSMVQVMLSEHDPDAGRAVITWTQTLDPEKAKPILEETIKSLAAQGGSQVPDASDLPSPFEVEDTGSYVVDTRSSWIQSLRHERTTTIGSQSQVEVLTITDKTK